jgi:hypothetical protein
VLLAATLEHSSGTAAEIFVTYLTAQQLQRMHETEGAYFLNELQGLELHLGLSLEAHGCAPNQASPGRCISLAPMQGVWAIK